MALDRVVRFKDKKPTQDEIQIILEDYLNGAQTSIKWDKDRFFIDLPGSPSAPFRRLETLYHPCSETAERWIEVWPDKKFSCVYVMTRHADDFTNDIAKGIANLFVRFYQGTLEGA